MRIIYLDLDACTPSHLSCYGYHRQTSPTIDAIAQEGVRFNNVYCSDAPCLPSRTAFYQARFGIQTGVVGHGGSAADPKREGPKRQFCSQYEEKAMPRKLQMAGYYTAMISPFGQRHAAHHFYAGFNEIHNTGRGGHESAEEVQPVVRRWLDQNAKKDNWYLHINYWDIHTTYRVPLEYGNPFENEPIADWFTVDLIQQDVKRYGPHSPQDLGYYVDHDPEKYPRVPLRITDLDTLKQWMDGYDTAIRYVDDMIADIVRMLKEAGVYEDTAIIISADHGENQGELGIYGEHGTADHATCNIPFIVKWPGGAQGKVEDGLHYHLDWAPTIMQLLDRDDLVPDLWDGQAFTEAIRDGADTGRDELILSQCAHIAQRSVRFRFKDRDWIYIRSYHDGYHPFPPHMLFDLTNDPHERHDVAEQHPDVLREAMWRLSAWHDHQMCRMIKNCSDPIDPLWLVMFEGGPEHAKFPAKSGPLSWQGYLKRLEETGRADGAAELRRRYPNKVY